MDVVALRIEREICRSLDDVTAADPLCGASLMLVQSCPRAQVVPAYIHRNAKQIRCMFPFSRARLQNSVVHADVFALWIQTAERAGKTFCAEGICNLLE